MAHPRPQHGHARGDCSALDLLSRVALEQYAPPARRHWQLPAPPAPPDMCAPFAYECLPPLRSPDYSPVSSDDGSLRARAVSPRRALRLDKFVAIAKDPHSPRARTQPSRFCHICSRTSKKVGLIACGNFATGACRKVVCQKCFNDHGWDWEAAVKMDAKWICTHCRQACPERAQCAIYKRTNERRREQQQLQRVVVRETSALRGGHGRFINKKAPQQ